MTLSDHNNQAKSMMVWDDASQGTQVKTLRLRPDAYHVRSTCLLFSKYLMAVLPGPCHLGCLATAYLAAKDYGSAASSRHLCLPNWRPLAYPAGYSKLLKSLPCCCLTSLQIHVPASGNVAIRVPASSNVIDVLKSLGNFQTFLLALQVRS
jgi:hypothetical protein